MPYPGKLLVPTYSKAAPKIIFGAIPEDDLIVNDRLLCYRMRQTGAQKISLRAVAVTGRMAYLFHRGGQSMLIIRSFFVNPSGEYADVPWDDTGDFGYAAQACCLNATIGAFNELEYHSPAISAGTCHDTSQVWAFRGDRESIVSIIDCLISSEPVARELLRSSQW